MDHEMDAFVDSAFAQPRRDSYLCVPKPNSLKTAPAGRCKYHSMRTNLAMSGNRVITGMINKRAKSAKCH